MSSLGSPPHSHRPAPHPPDEDASLRIEGPGIGVVCLDVKTLNALPALEQADCYIVSTGHGTSGPFSFSGPSLATVANHCEIQPFNFVEVSSGDGFFTVLKRQEVLESRLGQTAMLALAKDGQPLSRAQGLVRLIVPTERNDALKQVKWISKIQFKTDTCNCP